MNIPFLITSTPNCEPIWKSLKLLSEHNIVPIVYDRSDNYYNLLSEIVHNHPDLVVYLGALPNYHKPPYVPPVDILQQINKIAPTIHLCGDTADSPWYDWLKLYHEQKCFALQIGIDGSFDTPAKQFLDMIQLCPIDYSAFPIVSWREKTIKCGMIGDIDQKRSFADSLKQYGVVTFTSTKDNPMSYSYMASLMSQTKIVLNYPVTGSGNSTHVKARVIEAGYANACLLEQKGSPTHHWFVPNRYYLEYETPEDVIRIINETDDEKLKSCADSLNFNTLKFHLPEIFWEKVFYKLRWRNVRAT